MFSSLAALNIAQNRLSGQVLSSLTQGASALLIWTPQNDPSSPQSDVTPRRDSGS